jgi:Transport and Golgi organisation 2
MCTAVLSIEPGKRVLLAGVRDELTDRPWEPPGTHWSAYPDLIGGRDLQAGGTWLAVMPSQSRVSCVLNGVGVTAPAATRHSRGDLPLLGAAGELTRPRAAGELPPLGAAGELTRPAAAGDLPQLAGRGRQHMRAAPATRAARTGPGAPPMQTRTGQPDARHTLAGYDPFRLLVAELDRAVLWTWDGVELTEQALLPGLHFIVNSGLASELQGIGQTGPDQTTTSHAATSWDGPEWRGAPPPDGREHELARVAHFLGRFRSATRPDPRPGQPVSQAWGEWFPLVNGDGIGPDDPRALIVRCDLGGGRTWGTTSISLVALAPGRLRYDFTSRPGDPTSWHEVL